MEIDKTSNGLWNWSVKREFPVVLSFVLLFQETFVGIAFARLNLPSGSHGMNLVLTFVAQNLAPKMRRLYSWNFLLYMYFKLEQAICFISNHKKKQTLPKSFQYYVILLLFHSTWQPDPLLMIFLLNVCILKLLISASLLSCFDHKLNLRQPGDKWLKDPTTNCTCTEHSSVFCQKLNESVCMDISGKLRMNREAWMNSSCVACASTAL